MRYDFVRFFGLYMSVENNILAKIFLDARKMGKNIWKIIKNDENDVALYLRIWYLSEGFCLCK